MIRLEDLEIFVRAADAGNLSAAARMLDCSPAVASAALARLEEALGQRLLVRSTRHAKLSVAGERYLPFAREALQAIEAGRAKLAGTQPSLTGRLQISAPSDFGRHLLRTWLDEFQERHPALELRLHVGDRLSDLFREPVDVAIRYGTIHDADLVALALLPSIRRVAVAAPAYLARNPGLASPQELIHHACLLYTVGERVNNRWSFTQGDHTEFVTVQGSRVADDGDVVRKWAIDAHGVACLSWLDVAADISSGCLVHLLPDWLGEIVPLHFVCAHRAQLSPTLSALRAHLLLKLGDLKIPFH